VLAFLWFNCLGRYPKAKTQDRLVQVPSYRILATMSTASKDLQHDAGLQDMNYNGSRRWLQHLFEILAENDGIFIF
jgi:hypothetical protein